MERDIKGMIEYPEEGINSKDIVRSERMRATLFCMSRGTELSEHSTPKEALIYVVDGHGIFNLNGKEIEMKPGKIIHMRGNEVHSVKANENLCFLLVLV